MDNWTKKVFVSYSWDSEEHQQWVVGLVNTLRADYGIDATADVLQTQNNLNKMMIDGIKNSDKTIVVLTSKYTQKANSFVGGVGFETDLMLNLRKDNANTLIIIKKDKCEMPFYVQGLNYIDFTSGKTHENIEELVLKINDETKYVLAPLNTANPKKVERKTISEPTDFIPNLKTYNQTDIDDFIVRTFDSTISELKNYLENTKQRNNNFDYSVNKKEIINNAIGTRLDLKKVVEVCTFTLVLDGKKRETYNLWCNVNSSLKGIFGKKGCGEYDCGINSYNFWASAKVEDHDFRMECVMGFNMFGEKEKTTLSRMIFNEMMESVKR